LNGRAKIIERYISRQIWLGLLAAAGVLLGIAWFSQVIRLLSYLVNDNLPVWTFIKLTSLLLPDLLVVIVPVALFAVVLFVYGRLIADKELVVMEAVGLPPKRLAAPALRIALVLTAASFVTTVFLSPSFERRYRNFLWNAKNDLSSMLIQEGEFNQISDSTTIFVRTASRNVLNGIFVYNRLKGSERIIAAERGRLSASKDSVVLSLENGSMQEKSGGRHTFGEFANYTADLGVAAESRERSKRPRELSVASLLFARERGFATAETWPKYLVELHKRLLNPIYNMLFAYLALAAVFSTSLNRRPGGGGIRIIAAVALMAGLESFFVGSYTFLLAHKNWFWVPYLVAGLCAFAFKRRMR
jgi:lipopolysaccharide export system permease protein